MMKIHKKHGKYLDKNSFELCFFTQATWIVCNVYLACVHDSVMN